MRAIGTALLAAVMLAGCTAGAGATTLPDTPAPATPSAPPSAAPTPTPTPASAPPSASPVLSTVYTADDTAIAELIEAGVEEAVPQLRELRDMDPGAMEGLFLPLGVWITEQRAGLDAYTPTTCTSGALELFTDGLDQYDAIRQKFLEWRDWGASGPAYPAGAPREARETFEAAVAELEATCPG
jgi:hypothetical protein